MEMPAVVEQIVDAKSQSVEIVCFLEPQAAEGRGWREESNPADRASNKDKMRKLSQPGEENPQYFHNIKRKCVL